MNTSSTVAATGNTDVTDTTRTSNNLLLQLSASAALGLVIFYGVAFAESPLLHNAAHDVRHITVQPCH